MHCRHSRQISNVPFFTLLSLRWLFASQQQILFILYICFFFLFKRNATVLTLTRYWLNRLNLYRLLCCFALFAFFGHINQWHSSWCQMFYEPILFASFNCGFDKGRNTRLHLRFCDKKNVDVYTNTYYILFTLTAWIYPSTMYKIIVLFGFLSVFSSHQPIME